ncbi:MAG: HXXEE domain-containing protein [Planctomycetota bacterium]
MPTLDRSPAQPKPAQLKTALAALALLFLGLYLPWSGQQFLVRHWMKIGTLAAPMLVFVAVEFRSPDARWGEREWGLTMLLAYIGHQFEEHWFDLYGREYAFIESVNQMFGDVNPLTPEGVYVINTALVWLIGFQSILWANWSARPLSAMWGIMVVNAFVHVAACFAQGARYNPGLLTAALVFLPVSVIFARSLQTRSDGKRWLRHGFLYGLVGHMVMVAGIVASGVKAALSESAYFAILVAYSLIPTVFAWRDRGVGEST